MITKSVTAAMHSVDPNLPLLGTMGAWLVGRVMSSMLYGVTATDYRVFFAVGGVLLASALIACYVPAQSAARVDPRLALRQE